MPQSSKAIVLVGRRREAVCADLKIPDPVSTNGVIKGRKVFIVTDRRDLKNLSGLRFSWFLIHQGVDPEITDYLHRLIGRPRSWLSPDDIWVEKSTSKDAQTGDALPASNPSMHHPHGHTTTIPATGSQGGLIS